MSAECKHADGSSARVKKEKNETKTICNWVLSRFSAARHPRAPLIDKKQLSKEFCAALRRIFFLLDEVDLLYFGCMSMF